MMPRGKSLDLLMNQSGARSDGAQSPFGHVSVSDLDHPELVDVGSLHSDARQVLLRGLKQSGRGFGQMVALVGDPGAGKSHLLWWLKRQHRKEALFVSIPALPDLAQPFRFTLKQFVSGLCKPGHKGERLERPIDRLLWEILFSQTYDLLDAARIGSYQGPTAVLKELPALCLSSGLRRPIADFAEAAEKLWPQIEPGLKSYLLTLPTENSLDSTARQVLLQFPHADRRALVTAWLAGEDLPQKDREKIGAKQTINQEATARYVLCSLIRLATMRRPSGLTIVFDQVDQVLEQLGQPGLHAQAEVLGSLHGLTAATLLILSCRPDTFGLFTEKQARPGPSQIKQNMELVSLSRIAPSQLKEVVTARLRSAAVSGTTNELHPLSETDLSVLHEVDTPRAALVKLAPVYAERLSGASSAAKKPAQATPMPAATGKATPAQAKVTPAPAKSAEKAHLSAKPPTLGSKKFADSGPDALAEALAQAEKEGVSVGQVRSLTHVDRSGPAVPKDMKHQAEAAAAKPAASAQKPSPALSTKPVPTAPKAAPGSSKPAAATPKTSGAPAGHGPSDGVPVSRADSGDTVRSVPDEALLARARDSQGKSNPQPSTPSKPGAATKAAPTSTPAAKIQANPATLEASAASKKPAGSHRAAPERAPSADTPSKAWLDMMGENDMLAEAMAAARAELTQSAKAEPQKPIKAKPVEPLPKGAKPLPPSDFEPTRQFEVPPTDLIDQTLSTADSAISPSVSWLAMANDEAAMAAALPERADAARPRRPTAANGVAIPQKNALPGVGTQPPPAKTGRTTQPRMAKVAIQGKSGLSPLRVLACLEGHPSMPETDLAQELGVPVEPLREILDIMAHDRQIELVSSDEGRLVVPL
ncbi:MAG TPA: hypothetical protein PKE31_03750 [Pseudomonadota bacterium]|nr:hypothetical protein [Pseudomonadota bacterium]